MTFGGQPTTGVSVTDASHIAATTPAHAAGAVNVVVTNGDGQIASGGTGAFTYVTPAPTFISIAPSSGSTAGGYSGNNHRCKLCYRGIVGCDLRRSTDYWCQPDRCISYRCYDTSLMRLERLTL